MAESPIDEGLTRVRWLTAVTFITGCWQANVFAS
jgi:hypothetical protein